MRLSREKTLKRAKFVINLYAANPAMCISEVRKLVVAKFRKSMNYKLLQKDQQIVEEQRKKAAPNAAVPAPLPEKLVEVAVAEAAASPTVTVWSPPDEFIEGLKLIRHAIYQQATAGNVSIVAAKDGKVQVSCQLSMEKTEDMKYTM